MTHFIEERVEADMRSNKYDGRVVTRFPPEPNGYPHIGHAKSICVNFGLAKTFGGVCHLRMDDTNPTSESMEYVESMKKDIQWLGFDWADKMYFASDYYQKLYDVAVLFIRVGKAYVDDLTEEQISEYRGDVSTPGKESPFRSRSPEENLRLFEGMNKGEFAPGSKVLRAKGELANPNFKMRDPLMYRIKDTPHYRTGTTWKVYPFYDFAHCFSDAFEGITHSICTLEFENNRELYDWYLRQVKFPGAPETMPEQIEFARLAMDYTVMSKRKLLELVRDKYVSGWDDPRMPTISGMRRRGYTPEAIRKFCEMIGVARSNSMVDIAKLEFCVREDLNERSGRLMAVIKPLKVVIENWPEGKVEELEAHGRKVTLTRNLYIEQDDFQDVPEKGFHRLSPGQEVRLRFGYVIKCVRKEGDTLFCTYDPSSEGRKVKGIIHWVSADHCKQVEVRLYDRLFKDPMPDAGEAHFLTHMNPHSLETVKAWVEPFGMTVEPATHWQFERIGFFYTDPLDSKPGAPVFNRAVALKDSWTKDTAVAVEKKPAVVHAHKDKEFAPAPTEKLAADRVKLASLGEEPAALLTQDEALNAYFWVAADVAKDEKATAHFVVNEVLALLKTRTLASVPPPKHAGALVALISGGKLTNTAAKKVWQAIVESGEAPDASMKALGIGEMMSEAALETIVKDLLSQHASERERLKGGDQKMQGFFTGLVMKASKGQANGQQVQALIKKLL